MSKLIYVVDDESNIRTMMQLFLENEGLHVETFKDGQEACQAFSAKEPDMLILDIMMPGIDGLSLCTYFRRQSHVPIIFVSAKDTPLDRVMGITLGSDDYITKPFSIDELGVRVMAHLRREKRGRQSKKESEETKGFRIRYDERSVRFDGEEIRLTKTEFDILEFLSMHPRQVFSKEQIYEAVRGWKETVTTVL